MLTAAQKAIIAGDKGRLESEVQLSQDPNQADETGQTLLMWSAIEGDAQMVRLLAERGASINDREKKYGYSALHFAAQRQEAEIVRILLDAGADIEAKDQFGNTPLNRATFYSKGNGGTISVLLRSGANPDSPNNYGVTPLSLAKQIANYDIAKFFEI